MHSQVHAVNSDAHILTGKAISQAVQAHLFVDAALKSSCS